MMGIMLIYLLFLITMGYGLLYFNITIIYLEYINYRSNVKLVLYKINEKFDIFDKKTLELMDIDTMNKVLDNLEITYNSSSESNNEICDSYDDSENDDSENDVLENLTSQSVSMVDIQEEIYRQVL